MKFQFGKKPALAAMSLLVGLTVVACGGSNISDGGTGRSAFGFRDLTSSGDLPTSIYFALKPATFTLSTQTKPTCGSFQQVDTLTVNQKFPVELIVIGVFPNGDNCDVTNLVAVASSSESLTAQKPSTGDIANSGFLIQPTRKGQFEVTASESDPNVTLTAKVTINATVQSISRVILSPNQELIGNGDEKQFILTGIYPDGSSQDLTNQIKPGACKVENVEPMTSKVIASESTSKACLIVADPDNTGLVKVKVTYDNNKTASAMLRVVSDSVSTSNVNLGICGGKVNDVSQTSAVDTKEKPCVKVVSDSKGNLFTSTPSVNAMNAFGFTTFDPGFASKATTKSDGTPNYPQNVAIPGAYKTYNGSQNGNNRILLADVKNVFALFNNGPLFSPAVDTKGDPNAMPPTVDVKKAADTGTSLDFTDPTSRKDPNDGYSGNVNYNQAAQWCQFLRNIGFMGIRTWNLPSATDLTGLYRDRGNTNMYTNSGWPTFWRYWTGTQASTVGGTNGTPTYKYMYLSNDFFAAPAGNPYDSSTFNDPASSVSCMARP